MKAPLFLCWLLLPSSQLVQEDTKSELSITRLSIFDPPWWFPKPHLSQLVCPTKPFQVATSLSVLAQLLLRTFLKSLKDSQTQNKQQLASACPVPLTKWPQTQHKQQLVSTCSVTSIRWSQAWHMLRLVLAWNIAQVRDQKSGTSSS